MKSKTLKKYIFKFLIYLLFFNFSFSSFANQNSEFPKSEISIISTKYKKQFKFNVDVADNFLSRKNGLQFKKKLKKNEGMLFIWEFEDHRYFWMKNTKLALDIIFINANFEIVDIFYGAKPFNLMTITSNKKAKYVLELNEGIFKNLNLMIGDKLILKKIKK